MKTPVDERLRGEASAFALRFACEDCVHFDPEGSRCLHGYPAAPRRSAIGRKEIEFCKEFELGGVVDPP